MVLNVSDSIYFVTIIFAFLTVVFGILVVNTLFRNKLKELFSDQKFFVFFFLVLGYALFAMGEVTWYLIHNIFNNIPTTGMPDFYWVTGAFFMMISFFALSSVLHQSYGENRKFLPLLLIGAALILGVILYVSTAISKGSDNSNIFLAYFYPISTSVILILSANLLLYFHRLGQFETDLLYLFFANICFLGGDLLYLYWNASNLLGFLSDIFYFFAYGLSAFAFFTLLIKLHLHSSEKPLR